MRFSVFVARTLGVMALIAIPVAAFAADSTWIRTYRGGYGHSVYETPDGGMMLAGTFGAGFDCCEPWMVKLNADGSTAWQTTYDAPGLAGANNIVPTRDGGYIMSGESTEMLVVKVDALGNVQWARNYGDGGYTHLRVLESDEGNFLVTGATWLGDGVNPNGRVLLLDPDGNVLWQNVYGRPVLVDYITSATMAYNGNFIVAGASRGDYWVMELDKTTGAIVWDNIYGGPAEDTGLVVARVLGDRYLVVGASDSYTEGGLRNWWVLLLSETGKVWKEFSLGGLDAEDPHSAIGTSDGGFMIGGGTGSFGAGRSDIWLVKFDSHARIEWQKAYGMVDRTDHAWQIEETATGYSVIGDSYNFPTDYEMWLMTLDWNGNIQYDECGSVIDTDVHTWRTRSGENDAGTLTFDITTKPRDMKVAVTSNSWPIEVCSP